MKLIIITLAATNIIFVSCKNEIKADTQLHIRSVIKTKTKTESKKEEVTYPLQIKPLGFDRSVNYLGKKKDNC